MPAGLKAIPMTPPGWALGTVVSARTSPPVGGSVAMFQSRMAPSDPPAARRLPRGSKATVNNSPRVVIERMSLPSGPDRSITPSAPAEARRRPSRLSATAVTRPWCGRGSAVGVGSGSSRFHTCTVPPSLPAASIRPSALIAKLGKVLDATGTVRALPRRLLRHAGEPVSQNRKFLLSATASRWPRSANATPITGSW